MSPALPRLAAAGIFLLGATGLARANDSAAEKAAGGLVLVESREVRMVSEDLRISPSAIDVAYVFQNDGATDQTLTVAFPLPAIEGYGVSMQPVDLPVPDAANFVGFTITVDGEAIEPELDERAFLGDVDVSAILRRHGVGLNPLSPATDLGALTDSDYAALFDAGLVTERDLGEALWRYEAKFHFDQAFPAGRPVRISHAYQPVRGFSFLGSFSFDAAFAGQYCVDAGTEKVLRKLIAKAAADSYAADPDNNQALKDDPTQGLAYSVVVPYILMTANNWSGPIGRFHLTLDKGDPGNVVSLCQDGLTKTGPTTFEFTAEDYVPKRDLLVLFGASTNAALGRE